MKRTVGRRHDAHERASDVCTEHSAVFDATQGGEKARSSLAAGVAIVKRMFITQGEANEARKAATVQAQQARVRLREAAKAVVAVGKLVSVPETVMSTLQLPGPMVDDELLAYAGTLLERTSAYTDAFVAEGLPPDLLKSLSDGIHALTAARERQAQARQRFAAASVTIRDAQAKSDKTLAALEAIAINTPAARPEVLTKLRRARRIGPRKPVDKVVDKPPTSTPSKNQAA